MYAFPVAMPVTAGEREVRASGLPLLGIDWEHLRGPHSCHLFLFGPIFIHRCPSLPL